MHFALVLPLHYCCPPTLPGPCPPANDQSCQAYLVQTGDTLNGIASAFNMCAQKSGTACRCSQNVKYHCQAVVCRAADNKPPWHAALSTTSSMPTPP